MPGPVACHGEAGMDAGDTSSMSGHAKPTIATAVGLVCALSLPLLVFPVRFLQSRFHAHGFWLQEAAIWALTAAVVFILVFWEKLPLSSIGLRRPTWMTLLWGIAGAIAVRIVASIVLVFYARLLGASTLHNFAHDLGLAMKLGAMPFGFIILLSVRAAVTEEILYRGYVIERLGAVTGSRILAAGVSLVAFTLAHLGAWDLTYLIVVAPIGLVLTAQYLWRRDLAANICTHFLTDAFSLVAAYAVAHHLVHLSGFPVAP
jgi:membrane protease YdiL (CAAX protease family)